MEKTPFQMTVKELEEYLSANFRNTGTGSSLAEALEMIEKKYLLSASPSPAATESKPHQILNQICAVIDAQPVDGTAFLQNTTSTGAAHLSAEDAIFAPGRDVAVTRLFSYLSAEPSEYDCFSVIVVLKGVCEIFLTARRSPRLSAAL